MIKKLLENKFGGRFVSSLTFYDESTFMPTFSIFDRNTGENFQIKIDSLVADFEMVVENVLTNRIIRERDNKIKSVLNGNGN